MHVAITIPTLTVNVGAPQVQVDINVFGVGTDGSVLEALLAGQGDIKDLLTTSFQELRTFMSDKFADTIQQLDEATTAVATRIEKQLQTISDSATPEEIAAAKARIQVDIDHLKALGSDPSAPVPEPPATDPSGEVIVP